MLAALTACAAGVGYGGAGYALVDVGYAGDFYEPYGYDYGGWGGHYHVGPPRAGAAILTAAATPAPSIPGRGRGH